MALDSLSETGIDLPPETAILPDTFPVRAAVAALAAATVLTAVPAVAAIRAIPAAKTSQAWKLKLATRYLPPATNRSRYDVVLVAGRAAWFFGGSNFAGNGVPKAERRQNGGWHASDLPPGLHSWIAAASATSATNIWAVTAQDGTVINWDGTRWTAVPRGHWSTKAQFTGIVAISRANVWVFGAKSSKRAGAGTWHLSGTTWTHVKGMAADIARASPVPPSTVPPGTLQSNTASPATASPATASPTVMWGIGGIHGTRNALLKYSNSTWRHVTPAALGGFAYTAVLALGPSNVWVGGSVAGLPELGHFDGRRWSALTMPGLVPATGMCRDGRGGLWVIANPGLGPSAVLDLGPKGHWHTAKVSNTSADEVLACAHVGGRDATWGAGKAAAPAGSAAAVYGFGDVP
ncbi:MAG TPA: hypothetical protein VFQ44_24150 [Streptosporangiaceae bacterium]|nr:hypothetical protein [Streptosporangiaceae bacterium]